MNSACFEVRVSYSAFMLVRMLAIDFAILSYICIPAVMNQKGHISYSMQLKDSVALWIPFASSFS